MESNIEDDSAEELSRLRNELKLLQKKLELYEPQSPSHADERRRVRRIFDLFDTDRSEDLDAYEFQELAFVLGETLTMQEVQERMKEIDQDENGRIDFKEFYEWWISPDRTFLQNHRDPSELRMLKARLVSKSIVRNVSRLAESKFLREEVTEDDRVKINGSLQVGKFDVAPTVFKLEFIDHEETPVEDPASTLDDYVVACISCNVKKTASDFDLGEISGILKMMLSLAKKDLKFSSYNIHMTKENDMRVFHVCVATNKKDFKQFSQLDKFMRAVHPKSFFALLELSQSPGNYTPDHALCSRLHIKGEMNRTSLQIIKEIFEPDVEAEPSVFQSLLFSLQSLSILKNIDFEIHLDSMQEVYETIVRDNAKAFREELRIKKGQPIPINGWNNIKSLITKFIGKELAMNEDGEMPPGVFENYFKSLALFEGIHSASVRIGQFELKLTATGCDIFSLFPNEEEIEQAKADEIQRSSFKSVPKKYYDYSSDENSDDNFESEESKKTFIFAYPNDKNGVIHYLASKLGSPPQVFASSIARGHADDFIDRHDIYVWTQNKPNSWYCVDLGPNRRLVPTRYTLKYGSSGSFCCPRNWLLQGATTLANRVTIF